MKRRLVAVAIAAWFGGIVVTMLAVWHYKMTPDDAAVAPARWPAASAIARVAGKPDLLVFAHPQCPCTRATMTELGRLADELHGAARIHIMLVLPEGTEPGFEEGTIAERARSIAGAEVRIDLGGVEANRFGAIASGTALLYSPAGDLQFTGGLTIARGHEGRGPAHDRILAAVSGRVPDRAESPVFGCALAERETLP